MKPTRTRRRNAREARAIRSLREDALSARKITDNKFVGSFIVKRTARMVDENDALIPVDTHALGINAVLERNSIEPLGVIGMSILNSNNGMGIIRAKERDGETFSIDRVEAAAQFLAPQIVGHLTVPAIMGSPAHVRGNRFVTMLVDHDTANAVRTDRSHMYRSLDTPNTASTKLPHISLGVTASSVDAQQAIQEIEQLGIAGTPIVLTEAFVQPVNYNPYIK